MTAQLALVLALLAAAIAMFAANRPRMDVVAILMIIALPFTGVISMGQALAGFSDANVVLIAALFVIGEGLVRTGVARQLGDWLLRRAGASQTRLLVMLMVVVCALGATMSSTAVTAIFIPVGLRIAQSTRTAPSQLMMPLSFAALISGMTTLVATAPNLVVNSELVRQEHAGFHFFAFTPFGVPILVLGILYMLFARRWLPAGTDDPASAGPGRPTLAQWVEEYGLGSRERRLRIPPGSPAAGATLAALDLRSTSGANILAIERPGRLAAEIIQPTATTELRAGDVLLVDLFAASPDFAALRDRLALEELPLAATFFGDRAHALGMAEVMVPADSDLIGRTLVEATFRTRTGLTALGLRRAGKPQRRPLLEERLALGDTLLVIGCWKDLERVGPDHAGVLLLRLPAEAKEVLPVSGKAPLAVACLLLVVGLMVSGVVPNVQAALIGCVLMGALGCIDLASAYRAIDWKTIVLIVGMLPFSIALRETGGVELAADLLTRATEGAGPRVVLAALFGLTALLGMFISNTATAVLMAPVALAVARDLGASPYPFAMIVALAASTAFITPVSSPVNTLVVTPGNYTFGDFVRVGGPFAIVVMAVCVMMVPWLLPF